MNLENDGCFWIFEKSGNKISYFRKIFKSQITKIQISKTKVKLIIQITQLLKSVFKKQNGPNPQRRPVDGRQNLQREIHPQTQNWVWGVFPRFFRSDESVI